MTSPPRLAREEGMRRRNGGCALSLAGPPSRSGDGSVDVRLFNPRFAWSGRCTLTASCGVVEFDRSNCKLAEGKSLSRMGFDLSFVVIVKFNEFVGWSFVQPEICMFWFGRVVAGSLHFGALGGCVLVAGLNMGCCWFSFVYWLCYPKIYESK